MDATDNYMNRNMNCNCNANDVMIVQNMNTSMMDNNNCCCKPSKQEPIATYAYQFTSRENQECGETQPTRAEMLEKIRCLGFAVVDIA